MKNIKDLDWLWGKNKSRGIIRLDYDEGILLGKYATLISGNIVEIGTRKGGSAYLLSYFSNKNVTTIDVHGLLYDENIDMLYKLKSLNPAVTLIHGDSRKISVPKNYDLLFIDGRHRLESVLNDTNRFWNNCNRYIAYHDYTRAIGVTRVVDFLLENKIGTKLEQQGSMIVLEKQINLSDPITL